LAGSYASEHALINGLKTPENFKTNKGKQIELTKSYETVV
jgi:hypothetical protein